MPAKPSLLNIDLDFINKPEIIGNQYLVKDFIGLNDIKTKIDQYMTSEEFIKKFNFKRQYMGQMANSPEQVIPFHKRLIDKKVVTPQEFSFIHVSSHLNLYSFGGYAEYQTKKEVHDYEPHNALAYMFVKNYIDKMIWVVPDYFDDDRIDYHFSGMDYQKKNGHHIVSINQGLRFVVKPVKWNYFTVNEYDWKAITIVANRQTAKFTPEDLRNFKSLVF